MLDPIKVRELAAGIVPSAAAGAVPVRRGAARLCSIIARVAECVSSPFSFSGS